MSQKKLSLIFQYKAILLSFKFSGHKFETRKKKKQRKSPEKEEVKTKESEKKQNWKGKF